MPKKRKISILPFVIIFLFLLCFLPSFLQNCEIYRKDVDKYIVYLDSDTAQERKQGLYYLQRFGPVSRKALPKIFDLLQQDKDVSVRNQAVLAIERIGLDDQSLPLARKALKANDSYTNHVLIKSIADLGYNARSALPELISTINLYSDLTLYLETLTAITKIAPQEDIIDELINCLNSDDKSMQIGAIIALRDLHFNADKALPLLKELRERTQDRQVKIAASETINIIEHGK